MQSKNISMLAGVKFPENGDTAQRKRAKAVVQSENAQTLFITFLTEKADTTKTINDLQDSTVLFKTRNLANTGER